MVLIEHPKIILEKGDQQIIDKALRTLNPKSKKEIIEVLKQMVWVPAAGVNLEPAYIHLVLGEGRKTKIIKKYFINQKRFIDYINNIGSVIDRCSKGALFLVLVDPSKFPDLHSSSINSIFIRMQEKEFGLGFYRTVYEKNKIIVYFLMSF